MSNHEPDSTGRILRARQFVQIPDFMADEEVERHVGYWPHPEVAYIAHRLRQMLFNKEVLHSESDRETMDRIEALLVYARDYLSWWLEKMDQEALLPDAPERPTPEEVVGKIPSWELFILLIGALHRAGAWVDAKWRRTGENGPTVADVIAAAYGLGDGGAA